MRALLVLLTRQLGIGLDDMFQYDMLARSLASGNGFRWYAPADRAVLAPYIQFDQAGVPADARGIPTTFRAPLYPAFLSIIYLLNGINGGRFFAARLAQAALGASLAPLTYLVARRIPLARLNAESDDRPARLAGWVVACYPTLIIYPLALATENPFFPLILLSVWLLLRLAAAPPRRGGWLAAAAGLCLGLTALTRSIVMPFALLAILWIWLALKSGRLALTAMLALLLVTLPWVIRNSLLAHRLTGIETSVGYNLYVGYHPQSTGTFAYGPSLELLRIADDAQRDRTGMEQALGFIRADPGRVPYLAARRLGYFFNLEVRGFTYFYVNDFLGRMPAPLLVLALLALALPFVVVSLSAAMGWMELAPGRESLLLLVLVLAYLVPHVLILSEERFHLALIPFLSIAAAASWTRPKVPGLSVHGWQLALALLLAALLLANWGMELARDGPTLLRMLGPGGNRLYLAY